MTETTAIIVMLTPIAKSDSLARVGAEATSDSLHCPEFSENPVLHTCQTVVLGLKQVIQFAEVQPSVSVSIIRLTIVPVTPVMTALM